MPFSTPGCSPDAQWVLVKEGLVRLEEGEKEGGDQGTGTAGALGIIIRGWT